MKLTLLPVLFALGMASFNLAHADVQTLDPVVTPHDPALERLTLDGPSRFEERELSIADATNLLKSTEGQAWRIRAVQAPACESGIHRNKSALKYCRQIRTNCSKASVFARKHGLHAACSALYTQTKVLLTNDAPPVKGVPVEHDATAKTGHSKRRLHKAHPVRKPAAAH
jgi:hypothetical protein